MIDPIGVLVVVDVIVCLAAVGFLLVVLTRGDFP